MLRNVAVLLLPGVLLLAGAPLAASAPSGEARYRGLPLAEALLDLQDRGLQIAFTSHLVRPEMRVTEEPSAGTLAEVLDELLRPHGLMARPSASGLYVVVPRPEEESAIEGRVVDRRDSAPLAGVRILLPAAGREEMSDGDGVFSIAGVAPGTHTLEAHLPGYVVERRPGVEVDAGRTSTVSFALQPAPMPLDEIDVTPSAVRLLKTEPVAALSFDRDEILALPHLGDDLFRALALVPGTSGNELSAELSIRGGRTDEVLVMLDNLELFEPYHLRDFSDALSIVAPRAVAEVDLILGGFPAEYGDRMGGVLEMSTVTPDWGLRTHVGANVLAAQAGGSGNFHGGRGHWLAVARRGSTELVESYLSEEERPRFWDAFAKAEHRLGAGGRLGVHALHADDSLDVDVVDGDGDTTRLLTGYRSSYVWLTHQALVGRRLFVDSTLSLGRIRRDRNGAETEDDDQGFTVGDERRLEMAGAKQDWNLEAGARSYLKWGFDLRRLETEYDYVSVRVLEDILDDIRTEPRTGTTVFRERIESEQLSVYLADRVRSRDSLTAELGLRYDEQTAAGDRNVSPRLNLVWALGEASSLRAAWGHYFQSQRVYELHVEDGETGFSPAERTEAYLVGYEHVFERRATLRVNAYHRDVTRPRSRFESVFEPVTPFPEVEPDRVRLDPERSTSQGLEIFLRGRRRSRFEWWASYVRSRVEDEIGGRDVPRGIDQPHALNVDASYRFRGGWTLHAAWRYHTGWPTTAVLGALEEDDEGELGPVLVFGPLYGERLPDYHRLDLRLSRRWQLKKGALTFFLEVQNLYDRKNVAGYDVEFDLEVRPDGQVEVIAVEEPWGGIVPSFGIDWEL